MRRILCLAFSIITLLSLCACRKPIPTWQEQYDLGLRYLSDSNYQEAIIAFTAAIEIDTMRPEAYLKAAEAYEAVGDSEAARAILERGYVATGDESLRPLEVDDIVSVIDGSDIPNTPGILELSSDTYTQISKDLEDYFEDIILTGISGDYDTLNKLVIEKTQGIIEYKSNAPGRSFWGLLSDDSLIICNLYTTLEDHHSWHLSSIEYRPVSGKGFIYRVVHSSRFRFYYGDMSEWLWNGGFQGYDWGISFEGDNEHLLRTHSGKAVNDLVDGEVVTIIYDSGLMRYRSFSNGIELGWPEGERTESGGIPSLKDVHTNGNVDYWFDLYEGLTRVEGIG